MDSVNNGLNTWAASVLTLYPDMFPGPLGMSLHGRALEQEIWSLDARDIRAYATDRHATVDAEPFGGGPGMVMRPDIVDSALADTVNLVDDQRPIIYLTPRGCPLDQARVRNLAEGPGVILLCGRFEGVDQRVLDAWQAEDVSVGDYVLSGGEPAALVLLDATVRLLPGVLGAAESLSEESFENGLLEYPQYTRPASWTDRQGNERLVPDVLTSGHHGRVAQWRTEQAKQITRERRPDLWQRYAKQDEEGQE